MLLLEQMLPMAQQRSREKNKPSAAPRLNQRCLGLLESRGGQRKKQVLSSHLPKAALTTFLPILGLCVLVNSRGDHRQEVCRCL